MPIDFTFYVPLFDRATRPGFYELDGSREKISLVPVKSNTDTYEIRRIIRPSQIPVKPGRAKGL